MRQPLEQRSGPLPRLLEGAATLLLPGALMAAPQTVLHCRDGDAANDWYGHSARGAGDVNADGFGDWIVGAPMDDDNGFSSGTARVYSGVDGTVLYTFLGDSAGDQFGFSVSGAGDVNADGYADLIVGAPQDDNRGSESGSSRVFSGVDGSILYTFEGGSVDDFHGVSVSGAGDVDADGHDDLLVGASGVNGGGVESGAAFVYSGRTGLILHIFQGHSGFDYFGASVDGAGDVDADGYDDLIVGSEYDSNNGNSSGNARVLSGFDGGVLYSIDGASVGDRLGFSVAGAGDVDADGFDDLIAGAPGDDTSGVATGSARVVSGADGSTLYTFYGDSAFDFFGNAVHGAGDVNGDGHADVVVGASKDDPIAANSGSVFVYSGLDGSILFSLAGDMPGDEFGFAVGGAGDVDGDGRDDVVVGTRFDDGNGANSGSACVYRLVAGPQSYCTAGTTAGGCNARISASGSASLSLTSGFDVSIDDVEVNKPGILFWGTTQIASPWGLGSSWRCVGAPLKRTGVQSSGSGSNACDGRLALDFNAWMAANPGKAPAASSVVYMQGWFRDPPSPKTTSLSDALMFSVEP